MYIYGLFCRNGELRYIGQTIKPLDARLKEHLWASSLKKATHKNYWIKSLLAKGLKPEIQVIQELYTLDDLNKAEDYYIKFFKEQGCDLTNSRDGGIGMRNPSSDVRLKMSMAKRGKPSPRKGKSWMTEETKEKLREANLGKKASEQTKLKMSASHKARYLTKE